MSPDLPHLPDRSTLLHSLKTSWRTAVGWVLAVLGGVALFLGWYGVSGNALTAKQLPYVVSGGLLGVALVVFAAALLATDDVRRQLRRVSEMERKLVVLYDLLVNAELDDASPMALADQPTRGQSVVAIPGGTSYHRPTCGLVVGKDNVTKLSRSRVTERGLQPCRVCDPAKIST